jgi:hypothetical protein
MLILIHNFYANSCGLGGGGLGLKTAWALIASILAKLYLILLLYGFHEARGSQFNVPIPLSSTTPLVVSVKLQGPASALLLNHLAPQQFLNHNKLAFSPL